MINNTFKTIVLTGIVVLAFTVDMNAQLQEKKEKGKKTPTFEKLLKKMDENEDGKLSKKEVKGPLKEHFSKIDTNEDGFISKKEFEKAPKPKRKRK